jgi:hypothetical protein
MSIVPPPSATLIWAFPTKFDVVRCFVWEHGPAGWVIAVMFGDETLALETAPTRWAMEAGVDMVWRGLLKSGLGKAAAESETLAAMSPTSPTSGAVGDVRGQTPAQRPMPPLAQFRQAEDRLSPHTPFRHKEPSFDIESSDPLPRRRPH